MSYQVMCSLRIYLRRGDLSEPAGFWRKLFRKPLATHLVHDALRAGIAHASLSYGNMGFARGAQVVATDVSEIPFDTLPVCVELIAPRPLLEQFVRDHARQTREATLVMHEGIHLRPLVEDAQPSDGVEYLPVGAAAASGQAPSEPARVGLEPDRPLADEG